MKYSKRNRVYHRIFGKGVVTGVSAAVVDVKFQSLRTKRTIRIDFDGMRVM